MTLCGIKNGSSMASLDEPLKHLYLFKCMCKYIRDELNIDIK